MTRPPRDPRPRPPAPADDEDVTRVGARAVGSGEDAADLRGRDEDVTRVGAFAVAPDDAVARSHLDAELGFEPLEEPVTQLGAAVTLSGDEDDAVVAPPIPGAAYLKARDAENAPGAPPDAPLVRPSPRSGLRSVDRGSQPYASPPHASPPAEPARPLVRGRGLTRRPGGRAAVVAVEPDPPDRRAAPAVSVPHQAPVAPTRGSRESATLGQAALAGALGARVPDDAMATRVSVARRATDPIGGGAVPDRADRVGRPPRDATAPDLSPVHVDGAPRESTDPTGRPVFMDREPTDPEGQPAIVVGTWERESFETPDLLGPPSNRTKRTQTAPHGAARVAGSGIVDASSPPQVSPTGLPASEPAETQRGVPPMRPPRAAAASLSIPGGRVPLAPPVAASEPPQAAAGPDGPVSLAGSRGVPFAPRGVTTEVPIEHRIPRSLAEAPGPRGLDRTGRVGEAGSVALRTSAVASASGLSSASGVSGPAASTVTALGVPDRSARSGLRGWSVLAMLLLFEAVALPTAAGPPWQHISDPGSVTFVALAFLLLTAVAHIVPARPVVRAGLAVAVGSLMLVFGLSLGRDAVAADLFDGQPALAAVFGAPLGAQLVALSCALVLPFGLLWRAAAPGFRGAQIAIGVGLALVLFAYLALAGLGLGSGPAISEALDTVRRSPFLGDRLVALTGLLPLLVALAASLTLVPRSSPRLATVAAVALWLAVLTPLVLAALFVAQSDAWMAVLEPLKVVSFITVPLFYLPAAVVALIGARRR